MSNSLLKIAFAILAVTVLLGAWGAHGLRNVLDAEALKSWSTATQYAFIHALGMILLQVSAASGILLPNRVKVASWMMLIGIFLFSGSIYLLTTKMMHGMPVSWLGPVTPIGGLLFVAGWCAAFAATFQVKREN